MAEVLSGDLLLAMTFALERWSSSSVRPSLRNKAVSFIISFSTRSTFSGMVPT